MPAEVLLHLILTALFGLLLGSFLNVCIYRVPRDLSVIVPRSFCPECGEQIAWYDNIPLVSYIKLRGRCRRCGQPIGLGYPLVELVTAALFTWAVAHFGWSLPALKWCVFEALMVVLFWTDLEERILPDEFTIGGTVAGLVFACFTSVPGVFGELLLPDARPLWRSLLEAAGGVVLLTVPIALMAALWSRLRRREMLGLGDIKLLPLIGVFLGIENGVLALLAGSLLGVFIGGGYIYFAEKKAAEYELPLGSFYCAAAALVPLILK